MAVVAGVPRTAEVEAGGFRTAEAEAEAFRRTEAEVLPRRTTVVSATSIRRPRREGAEVE
jgi:hypothetical protein